MSSYQGYLVYILFLPVLLQIVLPLFMLACWAVYHGASRLLSFQSAEEGHDRHRDRRVDNRYDVDGLGEVVATNSGVPVGRVVNVSLRGICLETLENVDRIGDGEVSLDLGGSRDVFTLRIKPRWQKMRQGGRTFGAAIVSYSSGWVEFITDGSQFAARYQQQG